MEKSSTAILNKELCKTIQRRRIIIKIMEKYNVETATKEKQKKINSIINKISEKFSRIIHGN